MILQTKEYNDSDDLAASISLFIKLSYGDKNKANA